MVRHLRKCCRRRSCLIFSIYPSPRSIEQRTAALAQLPARVNCRGLDCAGSGRKSSMRIGENSMTPIEALYQRARASPNGVAFIVGDDKWKYGWLAAEAERLARGLAGRGIRKGNRIAPHMPNRPEFVVAVYACFHIGAAAVPLNIRLKTVELKPLLERLRPAVYIGDANLYRHVDEID